ncbi:hypothetical protein [Nocardia sp. alder85J]|uniref:GAP1-N2 domain-containing protein n=1 Tax=Nocardia sp. alder85J TaxID=2862949 RepID=UPI001CD3FC81|nr:hypothetical protein [Nocardia sp. alder85J]MCX4090920.1 hypothetical protein [Nocardia sp. alder85J]
MTAPKNRLGRPAEPHPNRFVQLTYTSYQAPAAPGAVGRSGWQVKQQSPDITESERAMLIGWVATTVNPVQPIPPLPTAADIAALPRRLCYTRLDDRRAVYSHAAPAGTDPAGRPGNVFAHIVFDRAIESGQQATEPGPEPGARPIDRWRSPDWLTPFGQGDIANARLGAPDLPPRRGEFIDRAAVLRFLLGPQTWRIRVLRVLLDAVEQSLRQGPRVVLGVEDPDRAALWIGAVSYFMAGTTAAALNWTTFERAASVPAAVRGGQHIIAVPVQDLPAIEDDDRLIVLDATCAVEPGEYDRTPHYTQRRVPVPVSEWSVLADTVLMDYDTAEEALRWIDELAVRLNRLELTPSWPLAMVVAERLKLPDAEAEAKRVVARDCPQAFQDDPNLLRSILDILVPDLGTSAEDAWTALADPDLVGAARDVVRKKFVERALREPDWLGQQQRVLDPRLAGTVGHGATDLGRAAVRCLRELAERAPVDLAEAAAVSRAAVRTAELLVHEGLLDGETDTGTARLLSEVLDRALTSLLRDPVGGPAFVSAVGPVTDHVHIRYLLPAAVPNTPTDRPLGQRFTAEVADWLRRKATVRVEDLWANRALIESPVYHLVADAVFRDIRADDGRTGPRSASHTVIALCRALYEEQSGIDWAAADIGALFRAGPWDAGTLLTVDQRWPVLPTRFFLPALLAARSESELTAIATVIRNRAASGGPAPLRATPPDDVADGLARLWAVLATINWSLVEPEDVEHLRQLLDDYGRRPEVHLPSPLDTNLAITYILLRAGEFDLAEPGGPRRRRQLPDDSSYGKILAGAVSKDPRRVVSVVLTLVGHNLLEAYELCATAVLAARGPHQPAALSFDDPLRSMQIDGGTTIVEHIAKHVLRDPHYWGAPANPNELADAVRDLSTARQPGADPYLWEAAEQFARTWHPQAGDRHAEYRRTSETTRAVSW